MHPTGSFVKDLCRDQVLHNSMDESLGRRRPALRCVLHPWGTDCQFAEAWQSWSLSGLASWQAQIAALNFQIISALVSSKYAVKTCHEGSNRPWWDYSQLCSPLWRSSAPVFSDSNNWMNWYLNTSWFVGLAAEAEAEWHITGSLSISHHATGSHCWCPYRDSWQRFGANSGRLQLWYQAA